MRRHMDIAKILHDSTPCAIAVDLDGVVYVGDTPLPGAVDAVDTLKRAGYRLYFVTNNSGESRENLARKLDRMGIEANAEDVFSSGYASGVLIKRLSGPRAASILVIGTEELKGEIVRFGFTIVDKEPCDYVVVGLDPYFTYEKIALALDALNCGAMLIACNRDKSFPVEGGRYLPGCGPLVAAIEYAWGRSSYYEVGKPNTLLLEIIAEENGLVPGEMLVVGDSLESDIAMAEGFGCSSVLITGCTFKSRGDHKDKNGMLIMDSLMTLSEMFRSI